MKNITYETNTRQAEHKRKNKKCLSGNEFFKFLSASNAAMATIDTWAHNKRLMANRIIEIATWGHGHQYTRSYICKFYGYTTRTVTRLIKELETMGLIQSTVLFKRPNKYQPGLMALNDFVRQSLVSRLPALRLILSLVFLLSKPDVSLIREEYYQEKSAQLKTNKSGVGERSSWLISYLEFIDAQFPTTIPKKGSSMNATNNLLRDEESRLFRPLVGNLSSLELTDHGKAELEAYPNEAILAGDARLVTILKAGAVVASPLGYLIAVAKAWCKDNYVDPEHGRTADIIEQLGIDRSSPKFLAIKVSKAEAVPLDSVRGIDPFKKSACCHYAQLNEHERKVYLKLWNGAWRLSKDGNVEAISSYCRENLTCKPYCLNYSVTLDDPRSEYQKEQDELPTLTRDMRKERIKPAIANFTKLSKGMQVELIKMHPFPDAAELITELIQEERIATWTPIAQSMGAYTPQRRAQVLTENGFSEHIPLVEELIAKMGAV